MVDEPIYGVAVDAGSGLEKAIREARGENSTPNDLIAFKRAVLEILGPDATTVLLDATLGPELLDEYPENCARMLAYEADVYHISDADRITVLPSNFKVSDYPEMGVPMLKFFMYYAPDDAPELNQRKQNLVAKIGRQCRDAGIKFLMEPLVYHPTIDQGTAAYAIMKPELVQRAVTVFADPRFNVDVLKIEVPVDLNFVSGFGESQMDQSQVLGAFRDTAAAASGVDLVYLSAGVPFDWFEASLKLARESGVSFRGFMCGRAIWSDAVSVFGKNGKSVCEIGSVMWDAPD